MKPVKLTRLLRSAAWLGLLVMQCAPAPVHAAGQNVGSGAAQSLRWIYPSSDPRLWNRVRIAFRDELAPDEARPGADWRDLYEYKFLQKVGIVGQSALVIIGHQPAKEVSKDGAWDNFSSAYNFDLSTGQRRPIEGGGRMWQWKFRWLAHFGPTPVPDVTFTYLTCTECEPSEVFASFSHQAAAASGWQFRTWGYGKDPWWAAGPEGLVVGMDLIEGEGTLSFDCVYGLVPMGNELQGLAVRCKEVDESETGRAKIEDVTLLYILSHGRFRGRMITDSREIAQLTREACRPHSESTLCKLPGDLTITPGQNSTIDEMFPAGGKTSRDLADFKVIKKLKTIMDVVRECGRPDEVGGSGPTIFIYHLEDGSLVVIGSNGARGPILYANHITRSGRTIPLIPPK